MERAERQLEEATKATSQLQRDVEAELSSEDAVMPRMAQERAVGDLDEVSSNEVSDEEVIIISDSDDEVIIISDSDDEVIIISDSDDEDPPRRSTSRASAGSPPVPVAATGRKRARDGTSVSEAGSAATKSDTSAPVHTRQPPAGHDRVTELKNRSRAKSRREEAREKENRKAQARQRKKEQKKYLNDPRNQQKLLDQQRELLSKHSGAPVPQHLDWEATEQRVDEFKNQRIRDGPFRTTVAAAADPGHDRAADPMPTTPRTRARQKGLLKGLLADLVKIVGIDMWNNATAKVAPGGNGKKSWTDIVRALQADLTRQGQATSEETSLWAAVRERLAKYTTERAEPHPASA